MACADDSGDLKDAAQEEDPAGAGLDDEAGPWGPPPFAPLTPDEAARDAQHRLDSADERDEQRTLAREDGDYDDCEPTL
jgi:hypothetical protein